ncbi:MAG: BamA/TamA family outer membrane protein [Planctomycetaceae bacterium]
MTGVSGDTRGPICLGRQVFAPRRAIVLVIAMSIGVAVAPRTAMPQDEPEHSRSRPDVGTGQDSRRRVQVPEAADADHGDPLLDEQPLHRRNLPNSDEILVDVRVEGNTTIKTPAITKHIKSRRGRPFDDQQVRADIKSLYGTGWFAAVERDVRPTENGMVLVFEVIEKPIVQKVEYVGNKKVDGMWSWMKPGIKTKHLEARTGIKRDSPFDVSKNREAARKLEDFYHEKGYAFATVELEKGGSMSDREVIFKINEGPKVRVTNVKFDGNDSYSDPILKTKIHTKTAILWYFGGKYDPTSREEDMAAIREYYHNLGHFDVKVVDRVGFSKDRSRVYIDYDIEEGKRYKVGKIELAGNQVFTEPELTKDLKLTSGDYFNARYLNKDLDKINEKYYEQGRLFARVEAVPRFYEEEGVADLVYKINEDKPYRIRLVNVHILGDYPHTKRSVVLNEIRFHPGDLANKKMIKLSETRLAGCGYFMRDPVHAPRIEIERVIPAMAEEETNAFRGQSEGVGYGLSDLWKERLDNPDADDEASYDSSEQSASADAATGHNQFAAADGQPVPRDVRAARAFANYTSGANVNDERPRLTELRSMQPNRDDSVVLPFVSTGEMIPEAFYVKSRHSYVNSAETIIRAQSYDNGMETPGSPLYGGSPQGNPYGGPNANRFGGTGDADVNVYVNEERTGRLMFGVGVNSDAGVVGSIILSESNFDIMRPPTSIDDILNGTAWRGGGQKFRLEAVPGTVVSRYMASWTDPFFMNTDYSLGLSGFFYQRFFEDWDEQRAGGRIQVGRQLTPEWSIAGALRLEEVVISDPDLPTPPELAEVVGSNFLSTGRVSIAHDTRDSAFLPGAGHLIDLGYEQAFGQFTYPRAELEARQYFTAYSRPDGDGRHIVSLGGNLGWTGEDTPIFENFFAGGFQSFRGFRFRGVGPQVQGVRVGGQWLALGSVEYMFPMLANEIVHGVVFSDFGTVEDEVAFDDFRATAGLGLRVTIPAMGPVPLAFDFAFPIVKADGDDTQVFSFYVGIVR